LLAGFCGPQQEQDRKQQQGQDGADGGHGNGGEWMASAALGLLTLQSYRLGSGSAP
jgi:hypothetical protein